MTPSPFAPVNHRRFATTRWSLVLQAKGNRTESAAGALAELCRAYWYPLYVFVRKRSRDAHEAQDLTQSFFVRLMQEEFLVDVAPERGRFRAFLLASIQNFIANEWKRGRAIKRGGDRHHASVDAPRFDWDSGESRFLTEPAHEITAERLFERQWALALLDRVLSRLRDEFVTKGKLPQFESLQPFLAIDHDRACYAEAAERLDMTEATLRVAVHRLRKRYRVLLRDEIAHTVASPQDVDDEIRHLFEVIAH